MRTGSLLCEQSIDGFEPLGAFNQPVYRVFSQIHVALLNDLGPRCANYFSRPDVSRDGHRIGWLAQAAGPPRRWVDLSPEEQAALEPAKQEIEGQLDGYIARLAATPDNNASSNFGKVLTQAMQIPSPDYLYVMGSQPVLAFWGFRKAALPSGVDPLRLTPGRFPIPETPDLPAGPAVGPFAGPDSMRRPRRWHWLLLLLLSLLAAGVFFWFWHVRPRSELEGHLARPELPLEQNGPIIGQELSALGLPTAVTSQSATAARGGAQGPNASGTIIAESNASKAAAPAEQPPSAADPLSGKPADGLPPLPPPGSSSTVGRPLQVPASAIPGSAGFMQGLWHSRSGLQLNNKPAEEYYRFDKAGKGDVTVRSRDGSAQCQGGAEAVVTQNGQLSIKEPGSLACSDGSSLPGAITHCSTQTGAASCSGTNQSDGSRFKVQMEGMSQ